MANAFLFWILLNTFIVAKFETKFEAKLGEKLEQKLDTAVTVYRRNKHSTMSVRFLVCTRQYRKCIRYRAGDISTIFNKYKMTKVLVHGWQNDEHSEMPQILKDTYLDYHDVNVIIVGWGHYSKTLDYSYSVGVKVNLAKCIVEFLLDNLRTENPELSVHLIGHSLGAHVCGYVGVLLNRKNFLVYRISGLDPAAPLIVKGLKETDAFFVDIIHTSAGTLGQWAPAGHIDFYPNGGMIPQPLCSILKPQCSHSYAWKYFEHSIINGSKYLAYRCNNYSDFLFGYCGESQYMGEAASIYGRGKYYIDTMA